MTKKLLLYGLPMLMFLLSIWFVGTPVAAHAAMDDCAITVNQGFNIVTILPTQCALDAIAQGVFVEVRYEQTIGPFGIPDPTGTLNDSAQQAVNLAVENTIGQLQSCPNATLVTSDHGLNFWGELNNPSQFILDNLPYAQVSGC